MLISHYAFDLAERPVAGRSGFRSRSIENRSRLMQLKFDRWRYQLEGAIRPPAHALLAFDRDLREPRKTELMRGRRSDVDDAPANKGAAIVDRDHH
jgi:hypothetical protein